MTLSLSPATGNSGEGDPARGMVAPSQERTGKGRSNPYELAHRRKKAERLAAQLAGLGGTAEAAAKLSEAEWIAAAKICGVKVPSAETVKVVIEILREMEEFKK